MPERPAFPDGEEFTTYSLAELLAPPPKLSPPPDLAAFWQNSYAELTATPTDPRWEREESGSGRAVERITFRSSCGDRVIAWLVGPVPGRQVRGGLVISHGYGGRETPDPGQVPDDAVAVFPVAPWLPVNPGGLPSAEHVLLGIEDRDRFSHRFSVADLWRAATVLLDRYPAAAERLDYRGGSFGGGIGALALPWDARFRRATLRVPSFGHYPIRLTRHCTGSGQAVRQHLAEHPEHRATLDYFDSFLTASMITIAVLVSAALTDPAVDPRGQFAVYHALGGTKRLVVLTAGHAEYPGDAAEAAALEQAVRSFLAVDDIAAIPDLTDLSTQDNTA